ncbi:MAG: tRNA (adenosine(37)-N6)-dimethylallyltransferase MiaA [Desulfobacterales bacterium]
MEKPKVIVICGPTGIGKTAAAIDIARTFGGQIVSADSMQVYRYMDIGTAKPPLCEQKKIEHHMLDVVDPDEPFDAARYSFLARKTIAELHAKDIIPFIVGGTGLYIKALLYGLFRAGPLESGIRRRLKNEAAAIGSESLHRRLASIDSDSALKIHPHDTYRIIRALETFEAAGEPISAYQHGHQFGDAAFTVLKIGLNLPRETLYLRINRRVDAMIDAGFVDEVRRLLEKGYTAKLKSMQAIGYRHLVSYVQGYLPWDETVRTLKRDTRRYAKRQLTWFRSDPEIVWVQPTKMARLHSIIGKFLKV